MVEPGATSYQKLMIGVFDGEIDTSESVLCIHRAKKVEKDEKNFRGTQTFDFNRENDIFMKFLRNFFKNFRKKTCI